MESTRPQHLNQYDRTNDHVFKQYKRYKRKNPRPNFSEVIDFDAPSKYGRFLKKIHLDDLERFLPPEFCTIGLKHPRYWKIYELVTCPGFIVIVNPFISSGAQSYWVKQTLTQYTKKPYPSNLDVLMDLDEEMTMWEISHKKSSNNTFINQLRWVHMGYHFDYNVVDYKAKQYFGFPKDLAALTTTIANVFEFPDYIAETGIVNYYPEGSSMGGHTDHYEEELRQPLISYSFGQSAVYLIGGDTRDIKPEAIWVRSGDIMLMTGASRTAFHAVPCVLTKHVETAPPDIGSCPLVLQEDVETAPPDVGSCPLVLQEDVKRIPTKRENEANCFCLETAKHRWTDEMKDIDSWKEFSDYIRNTRINVNIRQVHKHKAS